MISDDRCSIKIGKSWSVLLHMLKFNQRCGKNPLLLFCSFFIHFSSICKLNHIALGISNFDVRSLILQKIVSTFWILFKYGSQNYLHTCETQKPYHTKYIIFVLIVYSLYNTLHWWSWKLSYRIVLSSGLY